MEHLTKYNTFQIQLDKKGLAIIPRVPECPLATNPSTDWLPWTKPDNSGFQCPRVFFHFSENNNEPGRGHNKSTNAAVFLSA